MRTRESEALLKLLRVEEPKSDDEWIARRFIENVTEARANGFDYVCVECGIQLWDDEDDQAEFGHESWCTVAERNAVAEQELAERIKRISGQDE